MARDSTKKNNLSKRVISSIIVLIYEMEFIELIGFIGFSESAQTQYQKYVIVRNQWVVCSSTITS